MGIPLSILHCHFYFSLYHCLDLFCRRQIYFFPENRIWHFMQWYWRQFACNIKTCYLGKIRKKKLILKISPRVWSVKGPDRLSVQTLCQNCFVSLIKRVDVVISYYIFRWMWSKFWGLFIWWYLSWWCKQVHMPMCHRFQWEQLWEDSGLLL